MMNTMAIEFAPAFEALTGHRPVRWQCRLFDRLRFGHGVPRVCDLPTGLGKTSVIVVWLIALLRQVSDARVTLPRRLIYIVNRRTVVDQATSVIEGTRQRLLNPDQHKWAKYKPTLEVLKTLLQRLCPPGDEILLGVSTLRGELADNNEWKSDPARPAVIIGTIDMIGSKLLFSGYGDGVYHRAHHAGLVGQDALVVHDEAHLTPAFSELLWHLAEAQRESNEPRPIEVMELSATPREGESSSEIVRLEAEDEDEQFVRDRLGANKRLRLHALGGEKLETKLADLALQHEDEKTKVLIYVRSPDLAETTAKALLRNLGNNAGDRVALLTGTIRGYERDRLVKEDPVYKALLDPDVVVPQTVYLVSTSAGEVGIDLDADHMVCDLTTLDSMIQRLGRVNRRGGERRAARVDLVVCSEKQPTPTKKQTELDRATGATLTILQRWEAEPGNGIDASPRNLRKLVSELTGEERLAAFSPKPTIPPLSDILLDTWSLTSVERIPGRPGVAAYLHGLTYDPAETYVAWREEIRLLSDAQVAADALSEWFDVCRIDARERLRDRTGRVKKALADLLKARRTKERDDTHDFPVVLLDERGIAEWSSLSKVVSDESQLRYRTVVLPVEAGGLSTAGTLDDEVLEPTTDIDVAEASAAGVGRQRWLEIRTSDGARYQRLVDSKQEVDSPPEGLRERGRIVLKDPPEDTSEEGQSTHLVLFIPPKEAGLQSVETVRVRQTLVEHTQAVVSHVKEIGDRLSLEPSIKEALIKAAEWHDRGKTRSVWQRFACNPDGGDPLAKSTRYLHGRALGGYRHEFGSLLEAIHDEGLRDQAERDLVLHLIAAHHGRARPHFDPRAFDNERFSTADNESAAVEVMRRFGHLQQRFGRWGLAWLESLLRCADSAASQHIIEADMQSDTEEVGA